MAVSFFPDNKGDGSGDVASKTSSDVLMGVMVDKEALSTLMVGACCCLAIFKASRRMRNSSNLFLGALAKSDVAVGVAEDTVSFKGIEDDSRGGVNGPDGPVEVVLPVTAEVEVEELMVVAVDVEVADDNNSRRKRKASNLDNVRFVMTLEDDEGTNKALSTGHGKYRSCKCWNDIR